MNEFSYLEVPFNVNAELTLVMNNGEERTCIRKPNLDALSLWFTDCTHPAQNALVNQKQIVKWKVKR